MTPKAPGEVFAALSTTRNFKTGPVACIRRRLRVGARPSPCRTRRLASTLAAASAGHAQGRPTAARGHGTDRCRADPAPRRGYATAAKPTNIAVLGGGLTGLTTAYYLTKYLPDARIVLYEASNRLGGWVRSDTVPVTTQDGKARTTVFERGPRMVQLRPGTSFDNLVLYELIHYLGLTGDLRPISREDSRDLMRYIFYPDRLVGLPNGPLLDTTTPNTMLASVTRISHLLSDVLTEPLYTGLLPSIWSLLRTYDEMKAAAIPEQDESIGDHFLRRFRRPDLVNNVLSAMVHGIYGGDVWRLSVRSSIFERLWLRMYLAPFQLSGQALLKVTDIDLINDISTNNRDAYWLAARNMHHGLINFSGGFTTLTNAMAKALRDNPRVHIRLGERVTKLCRHKSDNVELHVAAEDKPPVTYDKVISTLFSKDLATLCPPGSVPALADSHAVTISVVNLWYPKSGLNPFKGFGYLIPQSVPAVPVDQNPEAALGVLFDSDREAAAARRPDGADGDTLRGTKLTVMLGGHHWDGLPKSLLPDGHEATKLAQAVVQRSLGISPSEPVVASARLARECISQHYVGHRARMAAADDQLRAAFGGRLAVAGGSYTAQGVMPSLRAARDLASTVAGRCAEGAQAHVGDTGLRNLRPGAAGARYGGYKRENVPFTKEWAAKAGLEGKLKRWREEETMKRNEGNSHSKR